MTASIHHTPGRLRLRSPLLKNSPVHLRNLEARVRTCQHVISAQANPLTGSMLVRFDCRIPATHVLDMFAEYRSQNEKAGADLGSRPLRRPLLTTAGRTLAKTACKAAGARLMEYAIGAALSAIL